MMLTRHPLDQHTHKLTKNTRKLKHPPSFAAAHDLRGHKNLFQTNMPDAPPAGFQFQAWWHSFGFVAVDIPERQSPI